MREHVQQHFRAVCMPHYQIAHNKCNHTQTLMCVTHAALNLTLINWRQPPVLCKHGVVFLHLHHELRWQRRRHHSQPTNTLKVALYTIAPAPSGQPAPPSSAAANRTPGHLTLKVHLAHRMIRPQLPAYPTGRASSISESNLHLKDWTPCPSFACAAFLCCGSASLNLF